MSAARSVVGIDIGGANLKFAAEDRSARSCPFPMWRSADTLKETLAEQIARFDATQALAVTMTGELADCFIDRQQGVEHIVRHTVDAANQLRIDCVRFYGVDGAFHNAESAVDNVDLIAAANWHALASYLARQITADGLLVDIGSTTTDLIPLAGGRVETSARTDFDRLREGSLVYVGCRRTPVCALVDQLTFRGDTISVMNEVFATIDDALLVLGQVRPDPDDCDTADGRPRTLEAAANRLARMVGLDRRSVSISQARELAAPVVQVAKDRIAQAIQRVGGLKPWVISGHGEMLLGEMPSDAIRLVTQLGERAARCAPAFAVASLWLEDSCS